MDGGFFSNLTEKIINTDNVTHGVNVEVGKEQVAVDLNIVVEFKRMSQLVTKKSKMLSYQKLQKMTDLRS